MEVLKYIKSFLFALVLTAAFVGFTTEDGLAQQDQDRRKSPVGIAQTELGDTYLKVTYGRPFMKGREIFGSLVPFSEVWRTGANEATEITATKPVKFGDETLPAGTYSLFTIPEEDTWTIIVNQDLGQWGAYEYSTGLDLFRIEAESTQMDSTVNQFTMEFDKPKNGNTALNLMWENTHVKIPISKTD